MKLVNKAELDNYLKNDELLQIVQRTEKSGDANIATHKWLYDSAPKRMIYWQMYREYLQNSAARSVLDVGGGFTSLTRLLVQNQNYFLIDILAHGGASELEELSKEKGHSLFSTDDWAEFQGSEVFDVIIANDIFPNVDQRLELFLERFLPRCREMRLSLTFYPTPRYYKVKRTDGEEVFFMKAWDDYQTARVLSRFKDSILAYDEGALFQQNPSIFPNGRQVALVNLRGTAQ